MNTSTQSINPFYAARQRPVAPARPTSRPAGLCPPATGTDHRQPGAAPDQPVSLPPGRRVRRPQMARQLRRQPDQGFAEVFQAGGLCFDPMTRLWHVPRRVRGTRHPVHGLGHPSGIRRLRPDRFPEGETFDFIWAHPPYWRHEAVRRRSPRSVAQPDARTFLVRYGQFIRNCAGALKSGGKLAILMGDYSDRDAGYVPLVYHTKRLAFAAGLAAALHRHHPLQPRSQQRQEGLPQSASSPACTTCA